MKHNLPRRIAVGALTAGAAAGLVVMVPGAAFAAAPANATPANTTAGASAGGITTTTQASNPFCTPGLFSQAQQAVEAALSAWTAARRHPSIPGTPHPSRAPKSRVRSPDRKRLQLPDAGAARS